MRKFSYVVLMVLFCATPALAQLGQEGKVRPQADARVRKLLDELKLKYKIDKDGDFKLILPTTGNRTQLVFIRSKTSRYRNFEIREIFSVGYKSATDTIPADVANRLLEHSARVKMGAWERQKGYAIFRVKIAADTNAESLYSALKLTYLAADEIEKEFTGDADKY